MTWKIKIEDNKCFGSPQSFNEGTSLVGKWVPFTFLSNSIDTITQYTEYVYNQSADTASEVAKTYTNVTEHILNAVRNTRNDLLEKSDWTQVSDNGLAADKKTEWATYRQALRDLPATHSSTTSINDVVWPTKPT
tara:strand:+ start:585 stop:989 length:405 start_codon:yes stop_codon:yes gene_type:complete